MNFQKAKARLKALVPLIRESKLYFKEVQRGNKSYPYPEHLRGDFSHEARYLGIAYAMARGVPYEKIEAKVKDGNEVNWDLVECYRNEYNEQIECVSEEGPKPKPADSANSTRSSGVVASLLGAIGLAK